MRELVLQAWKIGFAKVSLTNLLRDGFGYSLSEAKAITDAILENKEIRLPCHDQQVEDVVAKLREIGVNVSVEVSD
jgi:ribosomal protein L7/L12